MAHSHTVAELLKILHTNKNVEEKCSALKHFRSNFSKDKKLESITDDDFITLYKILVGCDDIIQQEACNTLSTILLDQTYTKPNFLQSVQQIASRKSRVRLFSVLDKLDDKAILLLANDAQIINFFNDCLKSVNVETMGWLSSNPITSAVLIENEKKSHNEEEKLESKIVNLSLDFLLKIYKNMQSISPKQVQMYDSLLMEKIVTLVYMGLKNQRQSSLKVFHEAIINDLGVRVRQMLPNTWISYKKLLQDTYWSRMCLLVSSGYSDWATLWNHSIQLLGKDLHRGAGLINNLLSVEEKAFKSSDTNIRKQAFYSWKLLVDNFALDPQELASARRVKLLCIPLIAKNSKTEIIAFAKFEVWWHLIFKVYSDLPKVVPTVLIPFLNFCFGPLGDTPLLSSKLDICASPGKRFPKTKLASLDALLQFMVSKESDRKELFNPVLEERISNPIVIQVFEESYKTFTHSVFEALLILGHFEEKEIANRHLVGTVLWKNLILKFGESKPEIKDAGYQDLVLVITELTHHISNNVLIKNLLYDVILSDLVKITEKLAFPDDRLSILITALFKEMDLNVDKRDSCEEMKQLLLQCINNDIIYTQKNKIQLLNSLFETLQSVKPETSNKNMLADMWCVLAEILSKWLELCPKLNEGDSTQHNLSTIYSILMYPFTHLLIKDTKLIQKVIQCWWNTYKQFDIQADLEPTIKSNEVIITTANKLRDCLKKEKSGCYPLYAGCLNSLIININYESLLALEEVPSIVHLLNDLVLSLFKESEFDSAEMVLRSMSAFMITIYGQDRKKSVQYLEVIRPSTEFILSQKVNENLMKEIVGTWDTVVTILKGLNTNLTYDLLCSFQKSIVLALCHINQEIISQTLMILSLADNLDEKSKKLLEELGKFAKKSTNIESKSETKPKHPKIAGNFLNRKSTPNLGSDNFVSPSTIKVNESSSKKTNTAYQFKFDPDSQDKYVVIKSDVKFDVNRLTEHQKESLKKRRDDIPALYNDLSQSGSQDSQELQKWFEKKQFKNINSKERSKCDSNKENKETLPEESTETKEANSESIIQNETKMDVDENEVEMSVAKKLDFEFLEEFPESKKIDTESSSSKRPETRKSKSENADEDVKKTDEFLPLPQASHAGVKRNSLKRGKRKLDENETENSKRKKLHSSESSDNESSKSEGEEILNKRVKSEISRLQIDMVRSVFEPLPNRRRSKLTDCTCKNPKCQKNHSPGRLRSETKPESDKKPESEKKPKKVTVDSVKRRSRKNSKAENEEEKKPSRKSLPKLDVVKNPEVSEDKTETKNEETPLNGETESSVVESSQDVEDIVEGTQDIVSKSKVNNRSSEKELFIKLDKVNSTQKAEANSEESEKIENIDETKQIPTSMDEEDTFMETAEISVIPETSEKKQEASSSSSVKYTTVHISSPKGIVSRTKLKAYPLQGRAAQMLGLVTKQGLMEKDIIIDDEIKKSIQKPKNQESDNTYSAKKGNLKESENRSNQTGSRQDKIFSNMKSGEFGSSPPGKLFGSLKNDGEKISPKMKNPDSDTAEKCPSNEKESNLSPTKDHDLPILEWSSANPPSLTASPSAGILKRHNQSLLDVTGDAEITPNKRKRVSFADPPVSQKMGYEVATGESPHKISRPTRSHMIRRDTPLKPRQSKIKMFQIEIDKNDKSEVPMEVNFNGIEAGEEKSELVQISDSVDFGEETLIKEHVDNNQVSCSESGDAPAKEAIVSYKEITPNTSNQKLETEQKTAKLVEEIFGTQEDMFSATDTSDDSLKVPSQSTLSKDKTENISDQIMLDSVKFNTTFESQSQTLTKSTGKIDSLEDTVDVQNVSSFESTEEDNFCGKPIRCSTRTTEIEQDTLLVTDSVFENISQETQNSLTSIVNVPKPETLDSTYPIFPSLSDCKDSVKLIVSSLANPLWINHLESCLATRAIYTIGDLAKLSEREINRIPFKGSNKVLFVKNVLSKFENEKTQVTAEADSTHLEKTLPERTDSQANTLNPEEILFTIPSSSTFNLNISNVLLNNVSSEGACGTTDQLPKISSQSLSKSVAVQMELADLLDEIDVNLVLESAARRCTPESLLAKYKSKMRKMPEAELESETLRMLGINSSHNEVTLKSACKACGINKVLLKLPDIFSGDKQFFVKVLSAYKKKIQVSDCLSALDIKELKDALCQKCKSSELAEMLSKSLKDEEEKGINEPMEDLSDFNRILKRVPADLLISHTVANDELIPSHIVLDIALQNSSDDAIAQTLNAQSELKKESVFHKLWTLSSALTHVEKEASEAEVLEIIRAIGLRLRPEKLLEAFRDSMNEDNDSSEKVLLGLFKVISTKLKPDKLLDIFYECMKNKISLSNS